MPVPTPQVPLAVPAGTGREQRQWGQPGHRYEDAQRWRGGGGTGTVPPPHSWRNGDAPTVLQCKFTETQGTSARTRVWDRGAPGRAKRGAVWSPSERRGGCPPRPSLLGGQGYVRGGPCRLCCPGRASSQGRGASTGDTRVAPGPAPGQRRCWLRLPSQQLRRGAGVGLCRGAQDGGAAPPRPSGASPKRLG